MKKSLALLSLIALTLSCASAFSKDKDFDSDLGFTAKVDEKWICFSKETVKANPSVFEKNAKTVFGSKADREFIEKIKKSYSEKGLIEIFCPSKGSKCLFDNVMIHMLPHGIPNNDGDQERLKRDLKAFVPTQPGKEASIVKPEALKMAGKDAYRFEIEVSSDQFHTVRYLIQWTPSTTLEINFRTTEGGDAKRVEAFDNLVKSIKAKP